MDVLGFGESSVDEVYLVDGLPRPDVSKLPILERSSGCGGQIATAMAACAALGLRSGYLGPVGNDESGRRILEELRQRHVDTSRLIVREARSRYAAILVDAGSGDRFVLWERDPALDVDPSKFSPDILAGARVVHLDATDEVASIAIARLARAANAIVTCDLDAVTPHTAEFLSQVSIPILAEGLPEALTGMTDPERALRALRGRHPGLLCVTLGSRGAAALDGDDFISVPAVSVAAVDTTSAGDVFRAGFIYGILEGWPVERTLRFANAAAAVSATRRGAIDSVPSLSDVERHLR